MKRKGEALKALMREYDAAPAETVFVGDDVNDAEALKIAGLPCTPADGTEFARHNARYVTLAPAGRGAIREIADRILAARGLDAAALWAGLHPRAEVRDAGSV
jgi:3-deoxy-D-manno-octulosonate 8-phosphate phosphatase KdsC-like HAD superfamily phosphatase